MIETTSGRASNVTPGAMVLFPPSKPFAPFLQVTKACHETWSGPRHSDLGGHVPRAHGLDCVLSGRGRYQDARGRDLAYGPGTVILTQVGEWYCYDPLPGQTLEHVWLRFTGSGAEALLRLLPADPRPPLAGIEAAMSDRFIRTHELFRAGTETTCAQAAAEALALLAETVRLLCDGDGVCLAERDTVDRFVAFAQTHAGDTRLALRSFAEAEAVGYESFRKRFKQRVGQSPHAYWLQCKINRARSLLERTDQSIGEIADAVGYPTIYAFSAYFKRRTGLSPSAYRRQHAEWPVGRTPHTG